MISRLSMYAEFLGTRGLRMAVVVAIAFVAIRLLRGLTRRLVKVSRQATEVSRLTEQQTRTMAGIIFSTGVLVVVLLAGLEIFRELGFDVTPVAAAAGLASAALGFGAQNLIKDIINGFVIVFEEQFIVGDLIRVGDTAGHVEMMTLRRTVLRTDTGWLVTIPNGLIGQVANLSHGWSQTYVDVRVAQEAAVNDALEALREIAREFRTDPAWSAALLAEPNVLGVESLAAEAPTLRVAVRCSVGHQDDVAREMRRRIREGFAKRGIPTQSVHRVELKSPPN
jgi:moderate conductance mechanosensitive channel